MRSRTLALLGLVALCAAVATPAAAQSYSRNSHYPNPDGDLSSKRGRPCADPWVTTALEMVYGPRVSAGMCAIQLYNGGRWSSFNELVHAVAATRGDLSRLGYEVKVAQSGGGLRPVLTQSGRLVAAGAGNLIGLDGATLIGNDSNSLITDGGSTIDSLPGFSWAPPGARFTMADRTIPLSNGMLVIRK